MNKPNKPTAFITRSADRLTPRMYYAWVEYNGKEFEVGRYMTRYGALRGAVRCARELYAHEREHNEQREARSQSRWIGHYADGIPNVWDGDHPLPEVVDAADIQGLPLPYFLRCQEAIRDVEDAADIQGLPYVEDGETKFSFLDTLKDAGGKSQYVSGLQKLDDGELMY